MDSVVTALTKDSSGRPVAVWYNESDGGAVAVDPKVTGCSPADGPGRILMWSPNRIWTPGGGHTVAKGHIIDCARGPHATVTVAVVDQDDATVSTASLDSDAGYCVWEGAYRHAVSLPPPTSPPGATPPPPMGFRNPVLAYDVLAGAVARLSDTGGKPDTVYKIDPSAGRILALWPTAPDTVVAVCEIGLLTLTVDPATAKLRGRPVMRTLRGRLTSAVVERTDRVGVCAMTFCGHPRGQLELWVLRADLGKLVRDDRGGRWAAGTACVRVRRAADHVYTELSEPPATVVQHVSSGAGEHQVRSVATNKLV